MKRTLFTLLLAWTLILAAPAAASALTVDAAAAILIDASTGRIIYEQDAHAKLSPASTTKILTCLVVLENVDDLSATVTLPADFANVGESSIYLEPGETLSYEQLLYALMLRSANDAGQALAIGVAGGEEAFSQLMNDKCAQLGLSDSQWANPHGLDQEGHYTSAHDLALITKAAMGYEFFNTLVAATSYTMPWSGNEYDRVVYNHNQFLDLYEGADGVKTGYTDQAGSCLVGSATREGLRLIGVVLNAADHYAAMTMLMDYGFGTYQALEMGKRGDVVGAVKVIGAKVEQIDVLLGDDVSVPVEFGSDFVPEPTYNFPLTKEAPFSADEPIGDVTYTDELGNYITVDLYLAQGAERYTFQTVLQQVWRQFVSVLLWD